MSDYIDREAAIRTMVDEYGSVASQDVLWQLTETIRRIPAADVAPVRRGKWIWDDEGYHCSECFYHAYGGIGEVLSGDWHYCPNCGATMMDEEGKE